MKIISRRKLLKDNIILGFKRFLTINVVFFILLLLVRIYEYFYLRNTISLPMGSFKLELSGLGYDVLLLFNLSALLFFPFIVIYLLSKHLANLISGFVLIFFVLTEIALIQYLGTTSLLLGTDLFGYTFDEVIQIVSASGGFSIATILLVVVCIALMVSLLMFSNRLKFHSLAALVFVVISLFSLLFQRYLKPQPGNYNSELAYNLVANKAFHLFSAVYSFNYPDEASETSLFAYFYMGLSPVGKSFD